VSTSGPQHFELFDPDLTRLTAPDRSQEDPPARPPCDPNQTTSRRHGSRGDAPGSVTPLPGRPRPGTRRACGRRPARERAPLFVGRLRQVHRQIGNGHGLVAGHARSPVCRCAQPLGARCLRPALPRQADEVGQRQNSRRKSGTTPARCSPGSAVRGDVQRLVAGAQAGPRSVRNRRVRAWS
jgi:hypothetical protein